MLIPVRYWQIFRTLLETQVGTDTAYQAWDGRWGTQEGRAGWLEPDRHVLETITRLRKAGARDALDIGAGVGRHSRALARLGFATTAVDLSQAGLAEITRSAAADGLRISTQLAPMTELPFPDKSFDYALAFNVIYHGDKTVVCRAIDEIRRVLKPGGVYQGTMLSKRDERYRLGEEIAPNTFVRSGDGEKDHPHFYCNAGELVSLFEGFELLSLEDYEQDGPGSWHWRLVANRLT